MMRQAQQGHIDYGAGLLPRATDLTSSSNWTGRIAFGTSRFFFFPLPSHPSHRIASRTDSRIGRAGVIDWHLWALLITWAIMTAAVCFWTYRVEFKTIDRPGLPTTQWPPEVASVAQPGRQTLALFLHPRCPCSASTVNQLHRMLSTLRQSDRPQIIVYAAIPPMETGREWMETSLIRNAQSLPDCQVKADIDGMIAQKFGVVASGMVLLFDADDRRRFAGGVTASRGHEGSAESLTHLNEMLTTRRRGTESPSMIYPVFGCPLCRPPSELNVTYTTSYKPR